MPERGSQGGVRKLKQISLFLEDFKSQIITFQGQGSPEQHSLFPHCAHIQKYYHGSCVKYSS